MCSATATSFLPRIGWLLLEEIIHLNFSTIQQASLSFHFQVHKTEIPSNQDPEQGFSKKINSDLSYFIAGLFSCRCPFLPSHFSLFPLPDSPSPPPWQGSHTACTCTQDVLLEAPGPDGPWNQLLINHQAWWSCAQPLSPLNLPRSQCVGPSAQSAQLAPPAWGAGL